MIKITKNVYIIKLLKTAQNEDVITWSLPYHVIFSSKITVLTINQL